MKSLRHRLPPLNMLLIFEAAARLGSFTRAAEELHVTQAAVSKQIRALEDHLQITLFERSGRSVRLTSQGHALQERSAAAFHFLADGIEAMTGQSQQEMRVTVAANGALSHFWLGPALNQIQESWTGSPISFRLISSDHSPDLFADDVDIAVAYDPVSRPGWEMLPLFEEELWAVASPDYMEKFPFSETGVEVLAGHHWLDFDRAEPNWINWSAWLDRMEAREVNPATVSRFNSYALLIEAALHGQGIALAAPDLLRDHLETGHLIPVEGCCLVTGYGYRIALNRDRASRPGVLQVHQALQAGRENACSSVLEGKERPL